MNHFKLTNRFKIILKDKSFLKKTLAITAPVALQNMLSNLLNLIDTLMIGRKGETAVAAVGLANKVFFVFSLLLFGICSGCVVLASQYWGKRELLNIKRVLRIALFIGIGGSMLFMIPSILFPQTVMRIFTPQVNTVKIGAVFLGIIAFSYPLTAFTNAYAAILRSMNYVKLPVICTTIAIIVDVFLNYALIFGHFGFPELGVAGSALATLVARIVEFSLLMIIIYSHKAGDGGIGDFIHTRYDKVKENGVPFLHKAFLSKFFSTASPVIINEFMWGLGVTMYSLVYGRMGDAAAAVITICGTVEQVALVFFFGICSAAAVILGNEMGANELARAEEHSKNFIFLQICLSIIGGIITFLLKDPIISLFDVSSAVAFYISTCLTIFAIIIPVRMSNALLIVAVFRSGGDSKAAMFLDITGVWLIGIPMAILSGLILKLPVYVVYGLVLIEEVYKIILGSIRYRQKKWLKNLVASE
jgi:putative MATE family efflux protein